MLWLTRNTVPHSFNFGSLVSSLSPQISARSPYIKEKLDVVHVEGGLYEPQAPSGEKEITGSKLHVVLRFLVSFTLSEPLHVEAIKAYFQGIMEVAYMGEEISIPIVNMQWVLWHKGVLKGGKRYKFEIIGQLPSNAPPSLETAKGSIHYKFWTEAEGVVRPCRLEQSMKSVEVWNPYMVVDSPRQGLELGCDKEIEMVGTTIAVSKDFTAFIRYPDQWFSGTYLKFKLLTLQTTRFLLRYHFQGILSQCFIQSRK
jgi:hypothetical protein